MKVFMEQVDERFEITDRRFEELREDMNKRKAKRSYKCPDRAFQRIPKINICSEAV